MHPSSQAEGTPEAAASTGAPAKATRDTYIDFLRAFSLLVVVAWRLPLIRDLKVLPQAEQESNWLDAEPSVRPAE